MTKINHLDEQAFKVCIDLPEIDIWNMTEINYLDEQVFRVRIDQADTKEHWQWCRENLDTKSWHMKFGLLGNSCSCYFQNEEDATAFKLTFGL